MPLAVEDLGTLHALQALGCTRTQGYLHARAMPAGAFDRWLDAHTPLRTPAVATPLVLRALG